MAAPAGVLAANALVESRATAEAPVAPGRSAHFMQLESLSMQGLMQAFVMTSQTFPPRQEHAKAVALEALVSGIPPVPHL